MNSKVDPTLDGFRVFLEGGPTNTKTNEWSVYCLMCTIDNLISEVGELTKKMDELRQKIDSLNNNINDLPSK